MGNAEIKQSIRILLVEDNEINQQLVVAFFKIIGISVEVTSDGKKAIELLKQKYNIFDLVFMDCQMPVMDGYEATKQLRQIEHFNKLPIIAMSAHVLPSDVERALGAGMNDYITKPIDFNDVLKKMKKWICLEGSQETETIEKILNPILKKKSQNQKLVNASLDNDQLMQQLIQLEELIIDCDIDALDAAENLFRLPLNSRCLEVLENMVQAISDFNFEIAKEELSDFKTNLKV